jgi:hypothetical protein
MHEYMSGDLKLDSQSNYSLESPVMKLIKSIMNTFIKIHLISYLTFILSAFFVISIVQAQEADELSIIGQKAPEFSLMDLDGNQVSSESLKGNFVVIHIATT